VRRAFSKVRVLVAPLALAAVATMFAIVAERLGRGRWR
jgi:hypothetical protein